MKACVRRFDASANLLIPKAIGRWSAMFTFVCLVGSMVQGPATWAEDATAVNQQIAGNTQIAGQEQAVGPATVVSRTAQSHSTTAHRQVRYDQTFDAWIVRNPSKPVTADFVRNSQWQIFGSGDVYWARQDSAKEFRIYHRTGQSVFRFRCLGSDATSCGSLRRFAYLRDSNAWISHQPVFVEGHGNASFTGEASTLLDRHVDAIAWTADGRHIVYCRDAKFPNAQRQNSSRPSTDASRADSIAEYELVAYSLADDDFTVLFKFAAAKVRPVMGPDSQDGFYLVTDGNVIRQISLPVDVTKFAFQRLDQIPVLHRTIGSTVVSIDEDLDGRVHVLELDSNAVEFETILSVESDTISADSSQQR
ncbi:MAG: hypothetical protein ABJZ55_16375 [Fuerstiella sp.]